MKLRLLVAAILLQLLFAAAPARAQLVIYQDDFNAGVSGWSSNTNESNPITGGFLGRFRPGSPSLSTSRTFGVPPSIETVVIEFDFLEIDSWDGDQGDEFAVNINGTQIFSLPFLHEGRAGTDGNDAARSGTTGNVNWFVNPTTDNTIVLGFTSRWNDQIHRVRLQIISPPPSLALTLIADIDQSDEAVGVDNISVIGYAAPVVTLAKTSSISAATNGFPIPGAEVSYVVTLTSNGEQLDDGSIIITDLLPAETSLFTGDLGGSGSPVIFRDTSSSGLTCCTSGQISYSTSTSPAGPFNYTPNGAFDPNVRQIRIAPSGAMRNSSAITSEVEFEMLTRIE